MANRTLMLSDALARGRNNNFSAIRLAAAFAVISYHAAPIANGAGTIDPLEPAIGLSLGHISLVVFFFIAGLQVTQSVMHKRPPLMAFATARALRIMPGLLSALVFTAVLAVLLSGGSTGATEAAHYVARGASLVSIEHHLPGLFAGNPMEFVANGSIWSLLYTVLCYAVVGAVILGARGPIMMVSVCAAFLIAIVGATALNPDAMAYRWSVSAPLFAAFAIGAAAALGARVVPVSWHVLAGLVVSVVAANGTVLMVPTLTLTIAYATLCVAYRLPIVRIPTDLSYGVFLYGWPVTQLILWLGAPNDPVVLGALACVAVLPVAAASWVLVERPALALPKLAERAVRPAKLA